MPEALAGRFIRAADIVDTVAANVATDTSVGTAAANFTLNAATVRTALGGKLVHVNLQVITTNALTPVNGNITDTPCFTLDAAYRPDTGETSVVGTGGGPGEAVLGTDGVVDLRGFSDTVSAGSNLRMSWTYLLP